MERSELTKLLPKDRTDVEGARAILALGFPAVEPVLPSLFQWLETNGSEVELLIRPFFAELGEPALGLVRDALESSIKPAQKSALLQHVLRSWPADVVAKLEPQLLSYLDRYDFYGLDAWALKLLIEKGLAQDENLEGWRRLKVARLHEQFTALSSVKCGPASEA